jgi:hypothetical protein
MSLELWLGNLLAYCFQIAALAGMGAVLPLLLKLRHPRSNSAFVILDPTKRAEAKAYRVLW